MEEINLIKKLVCMILVTLSLAPAHSVAKERAKKPIHTCSKKDNTVNALACALYAEGRGEGFRGMFLIGNTILNRSNSDKYPSKIKNVIFQPSQFSYKKYYEVYEEQPWEEAQAVAVSLVYLDKKAPLLRAIQDPTKGALFYHKKGHKVYWSKKFKKVLTYKGHVFYKERKHLDTNKR